MSVLAVIPARLAAERLPGKPLRLLAGRPLVVRVWERVSALRVADACVIATDASEILAAARAAGAMAVLTDASHPSGTDRVAEVARRAEYRRYETVVNVQGDEPFIAREAICGAVELVSSGVFPLATAAAPLSAAALADPAIVKVVRADDGRALYFSRAPIPFAREVGDAALRDAVARQHVGVYAYTRQALERWVALPTHPLERIERLEQLRPLAAGLAIGVALVAGAPLPGVDTADDLARANAHWADHFAGNTTCP